MVKAELSKSWRSSWHRVKAYLIGNEVNRVHAVTNKRADSLALMDVAGVLFCVQFEAMRMTPSRPDLDPSRLSQYDITPWTIGFPGVHWLAM
jgi:hypothetical protein